MDFTAPVTEQVNLPVSPRDWRAVIKRSRLGFTTKAIALFVADYADYEDGTSVFPGVARLMVDSGASHGAIEKAMGELRKAGLLRLVRRGNRRRGHSDEYALALPDIGEGGLRVLSPLEYAEAVAAAGRGRQKAAAPVHAQEVGVNEQPPQAPEATPSRPGGGRDNADHAQEVGVMAPITPTRKVPPIRNYNHSGTTTEITGVSTQTAVATARAPEGRTAASPKSDAPARGAAAARAALAAARANPSRPVFRPDAAPARPDDRGMAYRRFMELEEGENPQVEAA